MKFNCNQCAGHSVVKIEKKYAFNFRDKDKVDHKLKALMMVYHCPDCKHDYYISSEEPKMIEAIRKFNNSFFRRILNVF